MRNFPVSKQMAFKGRSNLRSRKNTVRLYQQGQDPNAQTAFSKITIQPSLHSSITAKNVVPIKSPSKFVMTAMRRNKRIRVDGRPIANTRPAAQ